jgi:hypothetical protein
MFEESEQMGDSEPGSADRRQRRFAAVLCRLSVEARTRRNDGHHARIHV